MVGDSSRISGIRELLDRKFPQAEIFQHNENVAIAHGAAIYAFQYFDLIDKKMIEIAEKIKKEIHYYPNLLNQAISFQIVDELGESPPVKIFDKDTPLPEHAEISLKNRVSKQKSFKIKLYEGNNELPQDNSYIGQILISDLPPSPAWALKLKLTFKIDESKLEVEGVLEDGEKEIAKNSEVFKKL